MNFNCQIPILITIAFATIIAATSCNNATNTSTGNKDTTIMATTGITKAPWGNRDGKDVVLYTLTNHNGTQVKISNYGGTVTSFITKDKNGTAASIILGFNSLSGYLAEPPYFGATVGRYANRIAKGHFSLEGKEYTLATNDGPNHLHGGKKGFDKQVWDAAIVNDSTPELSLSYLSKDGEEGYPGNLKVTVHFTLTDEDALRIEYTATTDKATPINLTNHCYFNLSGDVANTILDETLQIDADHYTPVDTTAIPTGELKPVKGTPFDFTTPTKIGARIDSVKGGYDHNYALNKSDTSLKQVATLTDAMSGRKLEVLTTEPGLQLYTGNFLDGKFKDYGNKPIQKHTALCLETQHFPDAPNHHDFGSTILLPGKVYHTTTVYKVSLSK